MPIYEYRCSSCGHELEKLQRITDAPITDCPACEKPALKRLISAAGFRLKGSGWYETDFKKDNKRNVVESTPEGGEKSSGKDGDSKSSESKSTESKSSDSGKKDSKSETGSKKKPESSRATAA